MLRLPVITAGIIVLAFGIYPVKPMLCVFGTIFLVLGLFVLSPDFVTERKLKRWRWW